MSVRRKEHCRRRHYYARCRNDRGVTDLYLLWMLRHERYLNPLPDARLNMVAPEREMSVDTQEHNRVAFRHRDGEGPAKNGRQKMGHAEIDRGGVFGADNFSAYSVLPLSPTIALVGGHAPPADWLSAGRRHRPRRTCLPFISNTSQSLAMHCFGNPFIGYA